MCVLNVYVSIGPGRCRCLQLLCDIVDVFFRVHFLHAYHVCLKANNCSSCSFKSKFGTSVVETRGKEYVEGDDIHRFRFAAYHLEKNNGKDDYYSCDNSYENARYDNTPGAPFAGRSLLFTGLSVLLLGGHLFLK